MVMLGTPNMGSPCADLASALPGAGTPYRELRPDWVVGVFDKAVNNQRGVPFSVVAGNPLSNRMPTPAELEIGQRFLSRLIGLFAIEQIAAIGNQASFSLTKLGIPHEKVRHPSQGGKNLFVAGMARLFATK